MFSHYQRLLKRMREEEAGITALETAIILIAFVVVASVFAFTMLSAGTFSTERGKEAIYAGLTEVQSSIELKGGVIAVADPKSSDTVTGTVKSLVFTLSNTAGGLPVNIRNANAPQLAFEYRDANQRVPVTATVNFLNEINANGMLEYGELAEMTIELPTTDFEPLGPSTTFVIEIKPPSGAVVSLQRTTPAWLETINDLK